MPPPSSSRTEFSLPWGRGGGGRRRLTCLRTDTNIGLNRNLTKIPNSFWPRSTTPLCVHFPAGHTQHLSNSSIHSHGFHSSSQKKAAKRPSTNPQVFSRQLQNAAHQDCQARRSHLGWCLPSWLYQSHRTAWIGEGAENTHSQQELFNLLRRLQSQAGPCWRSF